MAASLIRRANSCHLVYLLLCIRLISNHRFVDFASRFTRYGLINKTIVTCNRLYTNKNLLRLHERKLLQDIFPNADAQLTKHLSKEICIYAGFDPTADSLHIGNLLVLMVLLHAQRAGHEVISVIGGATSLIGDPSGKSCERSSLKSDIIKSNSVGIQRDINNLFKNHEQHFWSDSKDQKSLVPMKILNNMSWYSKMTIIDFLSIYGKNLRLTNMLRRESVQSRINSSEGMNFTEFSYQAFQAYDWLHLFDNYKCMFQVGGNDQQGNVYTGCDLINRMRDAQCYGLFVPLAKTETGYKMGKSQGVPIWLNPSKTSPFQFYQYFVRLADADVESCLLWYTFLSVAEINSLMEIHKQKPDSRKAQKKLAELVTLLVHGENGLKSALRSTNVLYNGSPELLASLSEQEIQDIFEQAPSVNLILNPGITVLQMLLQAKCVSTELEGRQKMSSGGIAVNYRKVESPDFVLIPGEHILPNNYSLIRMGL